MSYLVFARKYRPQTFEQVVQQDHVTRTLANAIAAQRVAHAILFAGPRGTGKTTIARIMAKALNCEKGPTPTPCNTCRSCLEITAGNAADVFEIDGASNNSVDQVRDLRENLKYMPAHSRYKIYIIDEVHMLSLAAFNALLKTLEEPPEHVLFMFATTEVHKIPVTILSRCQRHDLRRVDGEAIAGHLKFICESENAAIDDQSLALIAQEAGGSIRDSLSLLDHVLACAEGPVTVQLIGDLLGLIDRQHLHDIAEAVLQRDMPRVLQAIDTVWRHGYEIKRFYADLVAHFHHLTLLKLGSWADQIVDVPRQEIERMQGQIAQVPESYLLQIFDLLFQAEPTIKLSSQPRLGLEMVFLKLFQAAPVLPIETLIDRLDRLQTTAGDVVTTINGTAADDASEFRRNDEETDPPVEDPEDNPGPTGNRTQAEPPPSEPLDVERLWASVKIQTEKQKPALAGFLGRCKLRMIGDDQLELLVGGNEFTLKSITRQLPYLENACRRESGRKLTLTTVADYEDTAAKQKQKEKTGRLRQQAMSHPLVTEAMELFNGRVTDIKVP